MQDKTLRMYGGIWGGLVPISVLVITLVWLSVAQRGGTKPFWACAWLALLTQIGRASCRERV